MLLYVTHYKNSFTRFLYSYFVQTPLLLWFKYFSRAIPSSGADFVNYTNLTPAQLSTAWTQAQTAIATKSFPATSSTGSSMVPANPKATTVLPKNVAVIACPDETISDLVKINEAWSTQKDPSGAILQLTGFEYETVTAFTLTGARPRVYAAASQVAAVIEYEFENIILYELGYDVSQR